MVNRLDIPHLRQFGRSFRSTLRTLRLISQYALQRLRAPRGTTLHLGNALAARLYASLLVRNADILFDTGVEKLLFDGDAVRGVRIEARPGRDRSPRAGAWCWRREDSPTTRASRAVFSRGGGFVSAASPGGTGDGLRLAMAGGADIGARVADPAYWVPASLFRRADGSQGVFPHTVTDRAKPGVIAVNASGRRSSTKRCRITNLSAPCWPTATTPRVVRSTSSAIAGFSGATGLAASGLLPGVSGDSQKRRVDRAARHRRAGRI